MPFLGLIQLSIWIWKTGHDIFCREWRELMRQMCPSLAKGSESYRQEDDNRFNVVDKPVLFPPHVIHTRSVIIHKSKSLLLPLNTEHRSPVHQFPDCRILHLREREEEERSLFQLSRTTLTPLLLWIDLYVWNRELVGKPTLLRLLTEL